MTDTQQTQSAPPRRALHRSRQDNILGGVSAGLGEHFAINAWWFRWAFIVLAFFGGLGVLLYVLAWIFIPAEDEENTAAVRWLDSVDLTDTGTILGVVLIGAAGIVIATQVINIPGSVVFAGILFAVGILLYRGDLAGKATTDDRPPTTDGEPDGRRPTSDPLTDDRLPTAEDRTDPDDGVPLTEEVGGAVVASSLVADRASTVEAYSGGDGGDVKPPKERKIKEPKAPKPPRESSMLGRITIAVALIVLSGMALLEASGITIGSNESGDLFDPIHYAATGLTIIGIGLIVGAFIGRARWLIIVGVLVLPLVFLSSVWPRAFDWTAGDWYFNPVSAEQVQSEYSHGAGQFILDLRALSPSELAQVGDITVTLGAGEATIRVPADTGVAFTGEVGLGQIEIAVVDQEDILTSSREWRAASFNQEIIGTSSGVNASLERQIGPAPLSLTLDVEVGAGTILLQSIERATP